MVLIFVVACGLYSIDCHAVVGYNTDSLLQVLDAVLDSSEVYETRMMEKAFKHRQQYDASTTTDEKFHASRLLYYDMHRLHLDSALYYARTCVRLARQLQNTDSLMKAQLLEAEALKCLGHYEEALGVLNSIEHSDLRNNPSYYYQCHSTLLSLSEITTDKDDKRRYEELMHHYRDSINLIAGDDEVSLCINQCEILKEHGQYDVALQRLVQCKDRHSGELDHNAIFWFSLADAYEKTGHIDEAKFCYTRAAIIDKRRCSKTYMALQNLAMLLYKEGEIERAYRYITISLDDVIRSGARNRLALVAEYLPIITSAHEQQQHKVMTTRNIIISITLLSILALSLLLFLLFRDNRRLTAMRAQLSSSNEQLQSLNGELSHVNTALVESNKIKEVYIAQLFNQCSQYINEMERQRTSVIGKLKAGLHKDVIDQLGQSSDNKQLKAFFRDFDAIFLELFPDFVERFNTLMRPGEELTVKHGELLSPELRIYALVRLGITDSTRIAGFLHYSPQTVYNYRLKVRNRSNLPRDEFAARIMTL